MKRIFSVSVENRFGVLSKVSSLFARRGYNIEYDHRFKRLAS